MSKRITVHMIGSAHIDPVWLWRWPAGVVEVLSTCRTAADLLDRYTNFIFCRSDVWVYETIERHDPKLFERIRAHIETGRWQAPGGWYIQPDCNLPIAASYRKHMEIGERYFREKFNLAIDVGFNVDSFGHSASLPGLMKTAGYTAYVMMRPMEQEMRLPANLFRWKGDDGSEITTWRIPRSYNAETPTRLKANIESAVAAVLPNVPEVMCFYGVGDHGGGPTTELIEWISGNADLASDYRLEFSHPRRFFDAIGDKLQFLPVVEGELQMHAIGCYSVVADIKRGIRRGEHALLRAERAAHSLGGASPKQIEATLADAWRVVLFNQFHDIAGGSSTSEACADSINQLSGAIATADSETLGRCFDHLVSLPGDRRQRIVAYRFGERFYDAPVTHEPWIHPDGFHEAFQGALVGESGNECDYQVIDQSAVLGPPRALVWDSGRMREGEPQIYYLDSSRKPRRIETDLEATKESIQNSFCRIDNRGDELFVLDNPAGASDGLPGIPLSIVLCEDNSDTWSHDIDSYDGIELGRFTVTKSHVRETGPIRSSIELEADCLASRLAAKCSIYRNRPWIDLEIDLSFLERFTIAKLNIPIASSQGRLDGIATGMLQRAQDSKEFPFMDWTLAVREEKKNGPTGFGVVSTDCFAFDGSGSLLRFTLVRSPVFAWHQPTRIVPERIYRHTDQGDHRFLFRLFPSASQGELERHADWLHQPPMLFDWTRGM